MGIAEEEGIIIVRHIGNMIPIGRKEMKDYEKLALNFGRHIVKQEWESAHSLLSAELQSTTSPKDIEHEVRNMIAYANDKISDAEIVLEMEEWPEKKMTTSDGSMCPYSEILSLKLCQSWWKNKTQTLPYGALNGVDPEDERESLTTAYDTDGWRRRSRPASLVRNKEITNEYPKGDFQPTQA